MRITGVIISVQHSNNEKYGSSIWFDVEGLSINVDSALLGGRTFAPGDTLTVNASMKLSKAGKIWFSAHQVPIMEGK